MNLELFTKDNYLSVSDLLEGEHVLPTFEEMGGVGFVLVDGPEVIGFVWSLISENSKVAHVDYFFVKKDYRGKKEAGIMLITKMLSHLFFLEKKWIFGIITDTGEYTEALAKIYNKYGMDIAKASYCLKGDISDVISKLVNYKSE